MIRIYVHRDKHNRPVSIHELNKELLYPASKIHQNSKGWNTEQFVEVLEGLPQGKKYFEFLDWHKDIPISQQGYYLLHYGSSQSIIDNIGFVVLPPEVRDQINDGTLTLLVAFTLETFDNNFSIAVWQGNFCLLLTALGITRPNSVKVLLGADSRIMHEHRDPRVSWIYYPWFEAALQTVAYRMYSELNNVPKYNSAAPKKYKFLSLNRTPRHQRIIMTSMLEFLDTAKYGYISWPGDHNRLVPTADRSNMFSTGIKQNQTFEQFMLSNHRLTGTYHDSVSIDDGEWLSAMPLYQQAEFELINETHHQNVGDLVFLTEKTFRTLLAGMPFLMFGNPGSLSLLHRLGYRTFPKVFDECYDEIYAPMRSVEFVAGQVHKICTHSPSWSNPLHHQDITDIVNFNQTHFWTKMHAPELWKAIVHNNS
jgi:hypothetical protein